MLLSDHLPDGFEKDPEIRARAKGLETARKPIPRPAADRQFLENLRAGIAAPGTGRIIESAEELSPTAIDMALAEHHEVDIAVPYHAPGDVPAHHVMTQEHVAALVGVAGGWIEELRTERDSSGVAWTVAKAIGRRDTRGLSVTFFCPHHTECWGPETPRTTGIGASEEAVVYLAEALARRGVSVDVYAPVPNHDVVVRRGVRWHHLREFDHREERSLLVAHRAPWVAQQPDVGAKRLVVWHQDNAYPDAIWGPPVAARSEHVFVSEWHRETLARAGHIQEPFQKCHVLPNAVPMEQTLPG